MTLKTKMSLLLFLTSVSIVSIGFSSWSITAETTAEINGNIKVDNVISLEDCIYFNTEYGTNKMGIDLLRYYDSGFIDKDNYIVNNATMTAYYTVDLMKCKDLFTPLTTMVVDISLKYSDVETQCKLINNYLSSSTVTCNIAHTVGTKTNNNGVYNIPLTFTDVLNTYDANDSSTRYFNFSISYEFVYTGNDFKNDIYQYLYTNKLLLSFVTRATAK